MVLYNKACISDNKIGFLALMSFSGNLMSHGSILVQEYEDYSGFTFRTDPRDYYYYF